MKSLGEKAAEFHAFLLEHLSLNTADFIIQFQKRFGADIKFLAQQLNGMQRSQKKLPTWFSNPSVLYPPKLNLEQASSEITANYKANLFVDGQASIDLTGGFGIDSFYLAQKFSNHNYCEINEDLVGFVASNFKALGAANIDVFVGDGLGKLQTFEKVDLIYLDPSRRVEGQKKFLLSECVPNIIDLHNLLLSKADRVMVKLSPLADIKQIINSLPSVKKIHIISVKNECKEVVAILDNASNYDVEIIAINITKETETSSFSFYLEQEEKAQTTFSKVKKYVYEPNASILKSGAFKLVAERYKLDKLHPNTHLYASDDQLDSFPGRCFKVVEAPFSKANIISRNHPFTPNKLAKKYKIKVGAKNEFLLAFTDIEKPKVVFAEQIN